MKFMKAEQLSNTAEVLENENYRSQVRRSNAERYARAQNWILKKQNVTMQRLWWTLWAKTMQHLKEGYKNTCGLYYLLVAAVCIGWTGG